MAIFGINNIKHIGVIGSRNFVDYDKINEVLSKLNEKYELIIVSGGANGADSLGEKWADENHCETMIFHADWKDLSQPDARIKTNKYGIKYDANAGFRRNKEIVDNSDLVIAFWDGKSPGTKNSIDYANKTNTRVIIYKF